MTDSLSQYCLNCEAQVNTIEELRAANERWVIAFKQAEERANGRIEALQTDNAKLREVLQGVTPPAYFGESEESKAWWTKARTTLQETGQ